MKLRIGGRSPGRPIPPPPGPESRRVRRATHTEARLSLLNHPCDYDYYYPSNSSRRNFGVEGLSQEYRRRSREALRFRSAVDSRVPFIFLPI